MTTRQIQQMMDTVFQTSSQSNKQAEVVEYFRDKTASIEQMFLELEGIWESREIYMVQLYK